MDCVIEVGAENHVLGFHYCWLWPPHKEYWMVMAVNPVRASNVRWRRVLLPTSPFIVGQLTSI